MGSNISFTWLSHFFYNTPPTNVIENITLKCEMVQGNPFDEFDNTLWKQIDEFLTREGAICARLPSLFTPSSQKHGSICLRFRICCNKSYRFFEHETVSFGSRKYMVSRFYQKGSCP